MFRQFGQCNFIVLSEVAGQLVDDFKRAEDFAIAFTKRDAEQCIGLKIQLPVNLTVDLVLVRLDIPIDTPRATSLHDMPHNDHVFGNTQLAILDSQRRPAD